MSPALQADSLPSELPGNPQTPPWVSAQRTPRTSLNLWNGRREKEKQIGPKKLHFFSLDKKQCSSLEWFSHYPTKRGARRSKANLLAPGCGERKCHMYCRCHTRSGGQWTLIKPKPPNSFQGSIFKARWWRALQHMWSVCAQLSAWLMVRKQASVTGVHIINSQTQ